MPAMFVALTALAAAAMVAQDSAPPQSGDVIDFSVSPPSVRGWRYLGGQPCNSGALAGCSYGLLQQGRHLIVLVLDALPASRAGPVERGRIRVTFPVERGADEVVSSICVFEDRNPALAVWDRTTRRLRLVFFERDRFLVEERKTDGHLPGCRFDGDEVIVNFD